MNPDDVAGTALIEVDVDVDGSDEQHIPADEYVVRLIKVEDTHSKAGNRMLVWSVAVAAGQYAGFPGKIYTVTQGNAAWKAKKTAKAFGCFVKDDDGKGKISIPHDYKGRIALGKIEDDEWDGETVSRINDIKPHPQGYDFDPNADDDVLG